MKPYLPEIINQNHLDGGRSFGDLPSTSQSVFRFLLEPKIWKEDTKPNGARLNSGNKAPRSKNTKRGLGALEQEEKAIHRACELTCLLYLKTLCDFLVKKCQRKSAVWLLYSVDLDQWYKEAGAGCPCRLRRDVSSRRPAKVLRTSKVNTTRRTAYYIFPN